MHNVSTSTSDDVSNFLTLICPMSKIGSILATDVYFYSVVVFMFVFLEERSGLAMWYLFGNVRMIVTLTVKRPAKYI